MPIAITREVSASMADCQLSFVERQPIDLALARRQHAAYQQALREAGCEVIALPAADALPDAVFVEDVALVFDEVALMTRPGAPSRRAEGESVATALSPWRPLLPLQAPATLDGGDVLRLGRSVYVGASARSNDAAIDALRSALSPWGYRVIQVPMRECLHLKSAVTALDDHCLLINPDWVDPAHFGACQILEVDAAEAHAANILRIGSHWIYPACFPRTSARLRAAGYAPREVDVSELQKAEGAVTCCSLVFEAHPPG